MTTSFPVPPLLTEPYVAHLGDVEDAALDLYQRLADATRRAEDVERKCKTEVADHTRNARSLIATLAAERFEFERLLRRIEPELQRLKADDLLRVVSLYARSWDQKLLRLRIEVRDLTGMPISDDVEVESHVPDPSVSQTEVRETLTPLVLLDGKVIGLAKVVTSVPVVVTEDAGKGGSAAQGAEEPSPFPPPCGDPGMGP